MRRSLSSLILSCSTLFIVAFYSHAGAQPSNARADRAIELPTRTGDHNNQLPRNGMAIELFGGIGDGRTDNLPAFRAALAALSAKSDGTSQDGGCILLSTGVYLITQSIDLTGKHGLCLQGHGMLATVIKAAGDFPIVQDNGTFAKPTNKLTIRDVWFQCAGRKNPNGHGLKLAYTNTGLVENNFFTGCNHAVHIQGAWQLRLFMNRWDGAGAQQNNVCLFLDEPALGDPEHNNAVVATNNICQSPAEFGLRWLNAQGSIFTSNQWMGGIHGVYGCDPKRPTFADGTSFICQFVFFNGDQVDSTSAQGWLLRKGLASKLGSGISLIGPWAGNTHRAAIDIQGAEGLQILAADVESTDIGLNIGESAHMRVDGHVRNYNRRKDGSAAVALRGTTKSTIGLTSTSAAPVGYHGIVEDDASSDNSVHAGRAPCNVGLSFGGMREGQQVDASGCQYQINGMVVDMQFQIGLRSKGHSRGQATLTGLPAVALPTPTSSSVAALSPLYGVMRRDGGQLLVRVLPGRDYAEILVQTASGLATVEEADFPDSGTIVGQIRYLKR